MWACDCACSVFSKLLDGVLAPVVAVAPGSHSAHAAAPDATHACQHTAGGILQVSVQGAAITAVAATTGSSHTRQDLRLEHPAANAREIRLAANSRALAIAPRIFQRSKTAGPSRSSSSLTSEHITAAAITGD